MRLFLGSVHFSQHGCMPTTLGWALDTRPVTVTSNGTPSSRFVASLVSGDFVHRADSRFPASLTRWLQQESLHYFSNPKNDRCGSPPPPPVLSYVSAPSFLAGSDCSEFQHSLQAFEDRRSPGAASGKCRGSSLELRGTDLPPCVSISPQH